MIEFRDAHPADIDAMVEVQNAIHRAGLRASASDAALVEERYFDAEHSIACTVADVVLRGPFLEYVLETDRGETVIAVKPKRNDPLPVQERVFLSWSPADCHIFKAES